jgi:mRNA interferase HigB
VYFVKHAEWKHFEDVKKDHISVRHINESRLVFKIGGNKWRIDTTIDYQGNLLFINRVGTHEEYNKWKY